VRHPRVEYGIVTPDSVDTCVELAASTPVEPAPTAPHGTAGAAGAPPHVPPSPAAAVDSRPGRLPLSEDDLNLNTLHMPLVPSEWGLAPALESLISGLLTRNVSERLGSTGGARAVMAHQVFHGLEWELLRDEKLPAPFLPDPNLVYAKDVVPPLTEAEPTPPRPEPSLVLGAAHRPTPSLTLSPAPASARPNVTDEPGVATPARPVAPLAEPQPATAQGALAAAQSEEFLDQWEYVCEAPDFAHELRELVRKRAHEEEALWR
jgi:hypothetical protein